MNKREEGNRYEEMAAHFLEKHGVKITDRNFRCRFGEIDIIGIKDDVLIFFEVKYRSGTGKGCAKEAVTHNKQRIICLVSDHYRAYKRQFAALQVRYDVIAIDKEKIEWIPAAFDYIGRGF